MAQTYIKITDANMKAIKNFIGMCRLNGLEGIAQPDFTFKDERPEVGTITFDLFYRENGVQEACWNMTVRVDTDHRIHDNQPSKAGDIYSYLDSYKIAKGSLDLQHKTSKFNVFSF